MTLSSRSESSAWRSGCGDDGFAGGVGLVVAQQRPHDIDTAACQGQDGLVVFLALGSLAVIEGPGVRAVLDADLRGVVEDPVEHAVVAAGPVQAAGAPAGVSRRGGQPGVAGQVVSGVEGGHVAAGGDEELGAEQDADAGQAGDHGGGAMAAKSGGDPLVDLPDPLA